MDTFWLVLIIALLGLSSIFACIGGYYIGYGKGYKTGGYAVLRQWEETLKDMGDGEN